jgi:hypothetical protein
MMKALIEGSRICQIVAPGSEFEVAPGLIWIDVADNVTEITHRYVNGGVEAIPAPVVSTADQIKALESSITPRMIREAIAGISNPFPGGPHAGRTAAQAIGDIEVQIAALRAQL